MNHPVANYATEMATDQSDLTCCLLFSLSFVYLCLFICGRKFSKYKTNLHLPFISGCNAVSLLEERWHFCKCTARSSFFRSSCRHLYFGTLPPS